VRDDNARFLYLNRESAWVGFERVGLEIDDRGTLRLASVPSAPEGIPDAPGAPVPPEGEAAGVAVAPDGTVFLSDPERARVLRRDICDEVPRPVPCLGGSDDSDTRLRRPRGMLYHVRREAVLLADSGNHRVLVLDPATLALRDVWAEWLEEPWALAGDPEGHVYVGDVGTGRVHKLDPRGRLVATFTQGLQGSRPAALAAATVKGRTEIVVLDLSQPRILVFDPEGELVRSFPVFSRRPMGLAAAGGRLFVGDNAGGGVLVLASKKGEEVGRARGYEGPVAALALGPGGTLWLHPGSADGLVALSVGGAHVGRGLAWAGPFRNPSLRSTFVDEEGQPLQWHRIKAEVALGGPGAHAQLFVRRSEARIPPPVYPTGATAFPSPPWEALPLDATEGLLRGGPGDHVWVGLQLGTEDGRHSPAVSQARLDFDLETPVRHLPAIYREDPTTTAFLARLLFLSNGFFEDVEELLRRLPGHFDPRGTPREFLDWLAGWLAVELRERWPEEKKRQAIARAFADSGRRGTAEGLRSTLLFEADVTARLEEPLLHAAWWALPADDASAGETRTSSLGFTTRLAVGPVEGAVLGTTAVLDQSHLIRGEERGSPLFDDVAHQFLVQVSRADAPDEVRLSRIRALVEREKPAHTAFHLCVVEPRMRVGFQSLVGIDTIVAGEPLPSRLGEAGGLVLGGDPPGRIGEMSRIGETTRLGAGGGR
jgi:phage tail-like protein